MKWINAETQLPPENQSVFLKVKQDKYIGGVYTNWQEKNKNGQLTINGHLYSVFGVNLSDIVWLQE